MFSKSDELMMKAKKFLPVHMDHLPPELVEKARIELNETEETRTKCIPELRERIINECPFPCRTNDEYILQWLRPRKFNVDRASELHRNYYTLPSLYEELFRDFDEEISITLIKNNHVYILPQRDHNGCIVVIFRIEPWDPDEVDIVHILRGMACTLFYLVENMPTQICGIQAILDLKGLTLKQMKCITPRYLMLISRAIRNVLPLRFKHVHICNESILFQYLWSIFKFFLTEKIKKRIHFHGDKIKHLYKFIPRTLLPVSYGGDVTTASLTEFSLKELTNYFNCFEEFIEICKTKKTD